MGFHGRLAQLGAAAMRGPVNPPLDVETSESFDWIVPPRGRNNERGQRLTSKIWPQQPRFTVAAHFDPIKAEADPGVLEARRDGSYSEPALSGALPFILPPRRGRARLHMASSKFPRFWSLQFPVEIVKKSSSLMTPQGAPASISWLRCLVSSSHLKRTLRVACFHPWENESHLFLPLFSAVYVPAAASSAWKIRPWNHGNQQVKFMRWSKWTTGYWF